MDDRTHVVVGVAGAGKTAMAMDLMEQHLRDGLKFWEVGFLSFSRAACAEAVSRAAAITGEPEDRLTGTGFYKTIHAAVVRAMAVDTKSILDPDTTEGQNWYTEHLGVPRGGERGTLAWRVGRILERWDIARQQVWDLLSPPAATDDCSATPATPGHAHSTPVSEQALRRSTCENTGDQGPVTAIPRHSSIYIEQSEIVSTTTGTRENRRCGVTDEYNPIYNKDLRRHATPPIGRCTGVTGVAEQKTDGGNYHWADGVDDPDFADTIVGKFEHAKLLWGKSDFTDLLLRYSGLRFDAGKLTQTLPAGSEPDEVRVWFIDEAQDCSQLLWTAVDRLTNQAEKIYLLGDPYQSVYRFLGADPDELLTRQDEARQRGSYTLLNRTWRNPAQVVEWAEEVLKEQKTYVSRNPVSEHDAGSTGLVDWNDFTKRLHDLPKVDTMILGRTWFTLERVQKVLNERGIPWISVAEKHSSKWQCPAKLAFVLCMRDLAAGKQISEQDWRRVTETLPQKFQGQELFKRGEKSKWKKMACRHEPEKTLAQVEDWGATPYFAEFTAQGLWKADMLLLLDHAIDRYGVDAVRKPKIRVGTCHAVKGMEAEVVYCLAASTEASQNADEREEYALKYVTITRASHDYRLVVDQADVLRGKPLFWAAPQNAKQYDRTQEFLDERIRNSEENHRLAHDSEDFLAEEPSDSLQSRRDPGPDGLRQRDVPRTRSEDTQREAQPEPAIGTEEDISEWWAF